MKALLKFVMIDQVRLFREILWTYKAFKDEEPKEPALRRFRRAVVSSWRRSDTTPRSGTKAKP